MPRRPVRRLSATAAAWLLVVAASTPFASPRLRTSAGPLVIEDAPQPVAMRAISPIDATRLTALPGIRAFAVAGDVNGDGYSDVLIGTPGNNEVAVYGGDADGNLNFQTLLTSAAAGSEFGAAVSAAGDVNGDGYDDVMVGEPLYQNPSAQVVGRVSIHHGSAGGVSPTPALQIEGTVPGGNFGATLARGGNLDGDTYDDIVVGAPDATSQFLTEAGIVYVFPGSAAGVVATPLLLRGKATGERRGAALAGVGDLDGDGDDELVVGSPFKPAVLQQGRVFVYRGVPGGMAPEPTDSLGFGPGGALFGASVAPTGDFNGDGFADFVVGAPLHDFPAPLLDAGAVYRFHGSPSGFALADSMAGTAPFARLGEALGCAGDVNGDFMGDYVAGEPGYDGPLGADEGRVLIVHGRRPAELVGLPNRVVSSPAAGVQLGFMVGGVGDLGADGFSDVGFGAVFGADGSLLFLRGGVAVAARLSLLLFGGGDSGGGSGPVEMGASVATGGDVNGDGLDDAVLGCPRCGVSLPNEGTAYVQLGEATSGGLLTNGTTLAGEQADSRFGAAVALAGDVDGDGYDDALVGAPDYDAGGGGEGRASLFRGVPAGTMTTPLWTSTGSPGRHWGSAVSAAGDMNRDGYADIAVASYHDASAGALAGRVAIHLGGAAGPSAEPAFEVFGDSAGDSLGFAMAAAGDVNGDQYDDLLIGAPGDSLATGSAFVVYGGATTPYTIHRFATSYQPGSGFGRALAGRADVDGDGYGDVAVGAPRNTYSVSNSGSVRVYRGGPGGLSSTVSSGIGGDLPFDFFGAAVSFGDFTGDGRSDLCVGAPGVDTTTSGVGAVYVFVAAGDGTFAAPASSKLIQALTNRFGRGASLAANGDFNGDGLADMVFGLPGSTFGSGGLVGTASAGGQLHSRDVRERMRRSDDSAPIALQGGATEANLRLLARTASGRQRLEVHHQAGPVTTPYASLPVLLSIAATPGAPDPTAGVTLDVGQLVGFPAGTSVKWRMRVRSEFPWTPWTRWFTPAGNAATLTDLLIPDGSVAVDPAPGIRGSERLTLEAPAPNPSRGGVTITFALPRAARVRVAIHDAAGRLVRELADGEHPAGTLRFAWDGGDARGEAAPSGIYFARVVTPDEQVARRFVRLR